MHPYIQGQSEEIDKRAVEYFKNQEIDEVKRSIELLKLTEIPDIRYGDIDYDPDSRRLIINLHAKSSRIKKAKSIGKFSEVVTFLNRSVGGVISPNILASNINLEIILNYRTCLGLKLNRVRILNCVIHNTRFDFLEHT